MPLGMDDNDFFADTLEVRKTKLAKGDVFLQYTDGLSEAMNPGREQFGYERMEKILQKTAALSTEKILATLTANVEKFAETKLSEPGPSDLSDDIALVCLKRL
jgi:serine phosphatase RsbU (regulator of sigma subunit)